MEEPQKLLYYSISKLKKIPYNHLSSKGSMMTTVDDPPELPNEISTSSNAGKDCFSLQPCLISSLRFAEEVVYEIFLRLPVKSLMRFRCVSKGMRRLIDSPIFIKNHNILRSVISESDREYAIFLYQPGFHRLFSLRFDNKLMNRGRAVELNSTFVKQGMEGLGWCCNGIFCFTTTLPNPQRYILWNPCNGTFREVDCSSRLISFDVSMGYDCVNDDYKIVRFIDTTDEKSLDLYSFRKDSWRKFPRDFPEGPDGYGLTSGVCLGGVMHRLWTNPTDDSVFIVAFDLAAETFTSLPLPLEARQLQLQPCQFTDFRDRLCVIFSPSSRHGAHTMWVMEKYGVETSWTKLYNLDRATHLTRIFHFPNIMNRLLCNYRWLSWWDPQDASDDERVEIPGLLNDRAFMPSLYYYDAYVYVRNLLRLDQTPST